MAKYKIRVHVELVECADTVDREISRNNDGSFSLAISEQDAVSIDKCEKSVLQTAYPAIRDAISSHLGECSKKKAEQQASEGGEVVINSHQYKVDGEAGRFTFLTHSVFHGEQKLFNTAQDFFTVLHGVELYKTVGFKNIAIIYGDTEQSYSKTSKLINRIRYQEQGGTPSRSLHECTEKEGTMLLSHITTKSLDILTRNGFLENGSCQNITDEYMDDSPITIHKEKVIVAIDKCIQDNDICRKDILMNPVPYEDPQNSVNIAIDDVNVKKQEELRPGGRKTERGKRKYIHNTIAHVSKKDTGAYTLNGHGITNVLSFVIAFLFHNGLIGERIQFFTDGHRLLNDLIFKRFDWYKNLGLILDWYHLEKKCKEKLSLALKGRFIRNDTLEELMPMLWFGLTDNAAAYLEEIPDDSIKNMVALEKLVEYLKRNKPYIPSYAVRKELGLCNSSAIGEKMNDLVVSKRQKHNGMSWSKSGSVSLATICALKRNKESDDWFENRDINFKLAA